MNIWSERHYLTDGPFLFRFRSAGEKKTDRLKAVAEIIRTVLEARGMEGKSKMDDLLEALREAGKGLVESSNEALLDH